MDTTSSNRGAGARESEVLSPVNASAADRSGPTPFCLTFFASGTLFLDDSSSSILRSLFLIDMFRHVSRLHSEPLL